MERAWPHGIAQSGASPSGWPAATRTRCASSTTCTGARRSASSCACSASAPAAEDVQQQVFLEAWQRGERYDPERGGLLTWLLQIARSRAIDQLRRRVPEPRDPASAVALADRADESHARRPARALADGRRARPAAHRGGRPAAPALLRSASRQTEIAAATGLPLGTVKSRMVSGLRRLREALEGGRVTRPDRLPARRARPSRGRRVRTRDGRRRGAARRGRAAAAGRDAPGAPPRGRVGPPGAAAAGDAGRRRRGARRGAARRRRGRARGRGAARRGRPARRDAAAPGRPARRSAASPAPPRPATRSSPPLCAVVLLAAGAGLGFLLDREPSPAAQLALRPVGDLDPAASGKVSLVSNGVNVRVSGLKPTGGGQFYELWLLGADKRLVGLGSFRVDEQGRATLEAPAPGRPQGVHVLRPLARAVRRQPRPLRGLRAARP